MTPLTRNYIAMNVFPWSIWAAGRGIRALRRSWFFPMSDTQSHPAAPNVSDKKHPYAVLGGLVLIAMASILALAFFGVSGPDFVAINLPATLWAMASALFVLTVASMYLYFTLRSASRLLAQHELKLQRVFERSQNLRIQSLEDSRAGSQADSLAQDGRLASIEQSREFARGTAASDARPRTPAEALAHDARLASLGEARRGVTTATAAMLAEIARLEAHIASFEESRDLPVP